MGYAFSWLTDGDVASFCAGTTDARRLRRTLSRDLQVGTVRPEWVWTARDGSGRPCARQHWWGPVGAAAPEVFVDVDRTDVDAAVMMLEHARDELAVVQAWAPVTLTGDAGDPWTREPDRVAVLERAGFRFEVDRVRVEWRAGAGPVPARADRLSFRPAADLGTDALVQLFAAVGDGSLDDSMRRDRQRLGREGEARKRLAFDLGYPGADGRLVVAADGAGAVVGYVLPALDRDFAAIAEIGVAEPYRGRGHVDDLLAYGTRHLAAAGARRIVADTDCANVPMRAAFARAGYREFARRWDWSWHRRVAS